MWKRTSLLWMTAALLMLCGALANPSHAQAFRSLSDTQRWGFNDDSGIDPATQLGAGAFAKAQEDGIGWVRYWFYWNKIQPTSSGYTWTYVDSEVNAAINNGVQVYADLMWAPEWATQNTQALIPWHCMDSDPNSPNYTHYVPGRLDCDNHKPDVAAFRAYVTAAVSRYGDRIKYWGFWNEPNYAIFWHSWTGGGSETNAENIPWEVRVNDVVDNIIIPGAEAARAANPNVLIVGPETDNPDTLELVLQRDDQYFAAHGIPLFDVISFHQYAPGNRACDVLALIDRYKTVIDQHDPQPNRSRRPVWLTESWASNQAGWNDELQALYEGIEKKTWINKFFSYGHKPGSSQSMDDGHKRFLTRYQGCYTDSDQRALPAYLVTSNSTVESCIQAAANAGYKYAGLQWYGQCYAGNSLGYSQVADSECNTACTADSSEACGAAYRSSIYRATPGAAVQRLYEGCYTDSSPRALPVQLIAGNATVESCAQAAASAGYRFAGLQWYDQCYAGNSLGYQKLVDRQCNTPCTALPADTCGGAWLNSVFATGR
jgi:hypothetical protein